MGATINQITGYMFSKMEFKVPILDEQREIGAYFKNLDNLITLHQRKYDKYVAIKKALLQKMFPRDGKNVPEIRFKGFTETWEQRKFSDLTIEYKETVNSDCTLPVLTSSKTEGVILQEEHFGRKQNHDINGYNILPLNYCTYRNRSDGVDFTFNINKCCDKGIISKFYPVFYGKEADICFISLVLNNSEEVVREIAYTCTGTGQKVLSFIELQKMYLRVPSLEEQMQISAIFDRVDNLITLHQCVLINFKELFYDKRNKQKRITCRLF
ncbi:MAG: restriction endonuclease subunit S [Ruminococcus sp.]